MIRTIVVEEEHKRKRLDIFLIQTLKEEVPSRSFIQKLIQAGQVKVNDKDLKPDYKVAVGDQVSIQFDDTLLEESDLVPQNIALDVFYEDEDIIVINKPIGMTVHPVNNYDTDTLANALAFRFKELSDVSGPVRPGIVHRLDRETSGLILIAKNNMAHARLARQFEKHKVMKRYVALVQGKVQFDQGVVDASIERHVKYHDQRQVAEHEGDGKTAITVYEVIKRFDASTLIALYPQTGRTHQLRIHMKHLGHPILGDDKYGRRETFPRLALHAQSIGFIHPITKEYMEFSCMVPHEFLQIEKIQSTLTRKNEKYSVKKH